MLSQYACGHMSFLTVRIVGNILYSLGGAQRRSHKPGQMDGQTDGNVGNILSQPTLSNDSQCIINTCIVENDLQWLIVKFTMGALLCL